MMKTSDVVKLAKGFEADDVEAELRQPFGRASWLRPTAPIWQKPNRAAKWMWQRD